MTRHMRRVRGLGAVILAIGGMTLLAAEEDDLIALLGSNAGIVEKWNACQRLHLVGTARAVPALVALLGDERAAHAACHALEAIPGPEAAAALREVLQRGAGPTRILAADCLGRRGDADAVPGLTPLLQDADSATAVAAAMALGRIANDGAAKALASARNDPRPTVQAAAGEGLLCCGERLLQAGNAPAALAVYRELLAGPVTGTVRTAAWCGTVRADPAQGPGRLAEALADSPGPVHAAALSLIRESEMQGALDACLGRWDALPPAAQRAVLEAHLRQGQAALPTLRRALRSPHLAVRVAAWQGLARVPDPTAVPAAAAAAAEAVPEERDAARAALVALAGDGVREAFVTSLPTLPPPQQAELLRALGHRGEPDTPALLLQYTGAKDAEVRAAALAALGDLADEATLGPLLDLVVAAPDAAAREPALAAASDVCRAARDRERATELALAAATRLPSAERRAILPLLGDLPTARSRAYLQAAMREGDAEARKDAVRALSRWPDPAPATGLIDLARASEDATLQALALRGAVGVSAHEPDAEKRLALLRDILSAARRPEEKRLAIAGLGQVPSLAALQALLPLLDDAAVVNEAASAGLDIVEKLGESQPEATREAVAKVLASACGEAIRARAVRLRGGKPQPGPFVRHWLVCGPYTKPGAIGAEAVFDVAFAPEQPAGTAPWRLAPVSEQPNLGTVYPGQTDCAAYLKARVVAPREGEALLLLGSDDGVKAWLNGAVVFGNNVDRPIAVDGDVAVVRLRQGANELMLKVTQGKGGWMACARLVGVDGAPIEGLHDEPWDSQAYAAAAPAPAPAPQPGAQAPTPTPATLPSREPFRRVRLFEEFYAEGAYYGDFNRDGKPDVVAGPFWFEGPTLEVRHAYRPVKSFDPKGYSDNFLTYSGDFNGDGWGDILCVPFPGGEGYWYENPKGTEGEWKRRLAYNMVGNESPMWADVTGDGKPELLFCNDGYLGYAGPDPGNPDAPWVFHPVSGKDGRYQKFTHGIGYGDINGDGRVDLLEAVGWWEQPEVAQPGQPWAFHPQRFAEAPAQMLVTDVDGDGLADVITAWHCHHYGLLWYRQTRDANGAVAWEQHTILSPRPDVTSAELRASQLHALELVDMNGDGLKDILIGKRFWAHGPAGDPEPSAPAVVLWFELHRDGKGGVSFAPHLVDDDSGVGTQVAATDLDADGRPDVIVANKKGGFVHLSRR